MRLIDADNLYDTLEQYYKSSGAQSHVMARNGLDAVCNAPTVPAVLMVHGRWEDPEPEGVWSWDKRAYAQCSICKKKSYLGWTDPYCRYCGAKMDLEETP